MADNKKFFWLKLKRDFFKRHDIRIIEEMENGKDYILFYLKMLLESIDHEGELRFSETIPYNEKMLSVITNTNIDIVKSAMKIFVELNMIEILDDSTIYMAEVLKLTGSETASAERKRKSRERQKALPKTSMSQKSVTMSQKSHTELEKEQEKKSDLESEAEEEKKEDVSETETECDYCDPDNQLQNYFGGIFLTEKQSKDLLEKIPLETFDRYIERMKDYPNIKNHYKTMLKWYEEDTAVKKPPKKNNKFNNYTDTNEIDFKAQQEQILKDMFGDEAM